MISQSDREDLELASWDNSPEEAAGVFSLEKIINKMSETNIFIDLINKYDKIFGSSKNILELGGGQCWASCIIKHKYPNTHVIGSDISETAISSVNIWENIFRVKLDEKISCRSYNVPKPDEYFDLIFAFQSAHHFGDQRATLVEAKRLLRKNGVLIYLYEPVVGRLLYKRAAKRARNVRNDAFEDLLIIPEIKFFSEEIDLDFNLIFRENLPKIGLKRSLYYETLRTFPFLRNSLPHASDLLFKKRL